MVSKSRIDSALVERGLTESRSRAQQLIAAGAVEISVAGQWLPVSKTSMKVESHEKIRVLDSHLSKYVSRAGLKLEAALEYLGIALDGAVALDIGQSTGGFSDCLLHFDCAKVVGVDVGHDQLADKLRQNPQVLCLEGINARNLPFERLRAEAPEGFDVCVMDVSFISQTLIIPELPKLLKSGAYFISLVKPQFEVGKEGVAKGGLVKDVSLYKEVKSRVCHIAEQVGLNLVHYFESPIVGGDGNREFLLIAKQNSINNA